MWLLDESVELCVTLNSGELLRSSAGDQAIVCALRRR